MWQPATERLQLVVQAGIYHRDQQVSDMELDQWAKFSTSVLKETSAWSVLTLGEVETEKSEGCKVSSESPIKSQNEWFSFDESNLKSLYHFQTMLKTKLNVLTLRKEPLPTVIFHEPEAIELCTTTPLMKTRTHTGCKLVYLLSMLESYDGGFGVVARPSSVVFTIRDNSITYGSYYSLHAELHEKNKITTLEESTGDREEFCMFVSSKGLETPWVKGFPHVVPLGFASRGRELKAGHVVRKIRV
ncbi:hypothetical protein TURU_031463 [Turdus rufiventris]|nr:hypothetical protein TURU_031463 [Turdus rufiventris]